jgi:hypothetical protein
MDPVAHRNFCLVRRVLKREDQPAPVPQRAARGREDLAQVAEIDQRVCRGDDVE